MGCVQGTALSEVSPDTRLLLTLLSKTGRRGVSEQAGFTGIAVALPARCRSAPQSCAQHQEFQTRNADKRH